jgi:hypothetical protein
MKICSRRVLSAAGVLSIAAGAFVAVAVPAQGAAANGPDAAHQAFAKALLEHRSRFISGPGLIGLQNIAGEKQSAPIGEASPSRSAAVAGPIDGSRAPRSGLRNVRVNDPAADRHQIDQTTQSETTIAVSGSRVAVGFNDSQQTLQPFFTAASDLTGYAYSTDGGRTFKDGGTMPNRAGYINAGDPWMSSDRTGRMYYSRLALDGETGNGEVGVAVSTNGGRSWTSPTIVSPDNPALLYFGDKDAMTTGPDPRVRSHDNVYVTWDDFTLDPATGQLTSGLPLARSTNGGRSWSLRYIDRFVADPNSCSFRQYIGAQPFVDRADGRLYVAAERIRLDDPTCTGTVPPTINQVLFTSTDGGTTFGPATVIAPVTPSVPLRLGHGKLVRTAEFPELAVHAGRLYATWNDGAGGSDHIRLAVSADRGATWSTQTLTRGLGEIQPAITADRSGLHLAFYQQNPGDTLDLVLADSAAGTSWKAVKVTSVSFPGVFTAPQFDPVIPYAYMGDYIANVSDGSHTYLAWGDNRDIVKNFLWPSGRHDPDVFFAKR